MPSQTATVCIILLAGALLIDAIDWSQAIDVPSVFVTPADDEFLRSECKFRENETMGTCHRMPNCPAAIEEMNGPQSTWPTTCGFEGHTPLVCCLFAELPSAKACASFKSLGTFADDNVPFIVGGEKADPGEFPHMAVFGYAPTDNSSRCSVFCDGSGCGIFCIDWRCGGTLISAQHVLTAAHCVNRVIPIVVHIGVNNVSTLTPDTAVDIADIIIHPEYRLPRSYNDIAVIRLSKPVSFSPTLRPACLWQPAAPVPKMLVATGFGVTEYDGDPSPDLLKVWLQTVPTDKCDRMYPRTRRMPHGVLSSQMCAGDAAGGKDACKGDSGGPLQTLLDHQYHVVGVASFGQGCGSHIPAIYTRVSAYVDWIERIVWPA